MRAAHLGVMIATITDLTAYRDGRATRDISVRRTPTTRPALFAVEPVRPLPDPWADPAAISADNTVSSATAPTAIEAAPAGAKAPPHLSDPYLTSNHIARRSNLVEALTTFGRDYRAGFGSRMSEALQAVLLLKAAFATNLPSLSTDRVHHLACDSASRIVAHVERGQREDTLIDRIVTQLMDADIRAHRRRGRTSR